jgi:hypothetical protein
VDRVAEIGFKPVTVSFGKSFLFVGNEYLL